jgi:purine-nucleoside phosphorylase
MTQHQETNNVEAAEEIIHPELPPQVKQIAQSYSNKMKSSINHNHIQSV